VSRAESEQTGQALVGNSVRNGINVNGHGSVAEDLKRRDGLCVLGVFRGDGASLQKLGDRLIQMPFRCAQTFGDCIGAAQ